MAIRQIAHRYDRNGLDAVFTTSRGHLPTRFWRFPEVTHFCHGL